MTNHAQKKTLGRALRQLVHPANLKIKEGIETTCRGMSLQDAAQWVLKECNIDSVIESGAIPSQGPVVVIGNSSTPLGGITAVANVDRTDLYMLGTAIRLAHILNESETRLYLLYLSGQPSSNRLARFRNNVHQRRLEGIERDEAALRNAVSLRRAAQRVDRGGCLLFAPMGGTFFYKKDWKTGIGALLNRIQNPDTQIVFVRLYGGRSSHLFRLMNPYWFWPYRKQEQLRLRIQQPIPLAEFQDQGTDAAGTSELVKQRYIQVCGPL